MMHYILSLVHFRRVYIICLAITTISALAILALALPRPALAQTNADYFWTGGTNADVRGTLALGNADPRQVIVNIINIALGFLGILAVIITLAAGFRYMTSGGNEEARGKATSMLISGIVGLVIIFAAFAIAQFLINSLVGATS